MTEELLKNTLKRPAKVGELINGLEIVDVLYPEEPKGDGSDETLVIRRPDVPFPPTLKWVITGTGHCGTQWAAMAAKSVGFRATHEQLFQNTISDAMPDTEVEVSCKAVPHLERLPPGVKVMHLVRHPLQVIRSMFYSDKRQQGWAWNSREWVNMHLGEAALRTDDCLSYLCEFYIAWNARIDNSGRVTRRVRLEDGYSNFCIALGQGPMSEPLRLGRRAAKDAPEISWDDIPCEYKRALQTIAKQYGYGGE